MTLGTTISTTFVSKEVYRYVIVASLAITIGFIGIFIIYREQRKPIESRSASNIIIGICVASAGSLVMLLAIMFLIMRI